jgi:hypothetical protein
MRRCSRCRYAEWDSRKGMFWCRKHSQFVESDDRCDNFE